MSGWTITLAVLVVVLVAVAAVLAFHPGSGPDPIVPRDLTPPEGHLVLLLFSAASCEACRETAAVLTEVAAECPDVLHHEVDVAARPELVDALAVRGTPTTLVLDPSGVELLRVAGVPGHADLAAALAPHRPPR